MIIDNGDNDFFETGDGWSEGTTDALSAYEDDYLLIDASADPGSAQWIWGDWPLSCTGMWDIYLTYPALPTNTASAVFTIYDGNTVLKTVTIDQTLAPDDVGPNDVRDFPTSVGPYLPPSWYAGYTIEPVDWNELLRGWERLCRVHVTSGLLRVELLNPGSGQAIADAMWAVPAPGNYLPAVDMAADAWLDEGEAFTSIGSFTDLDPDTWTATVNYGDGSGDVPLPLASDNTFELTHTYADDGVYEMTVTVVDSSGGQGSTACLVYVANVAPTLTVSGDPFVLEDDTYTLLLHSSDPGTDTVSSWQIHWGDGQVETVSGNPPSVGHVYSLPGSYSILPIFAAAADEDGAYYAQYWSVIVGDNEPPEVDAGADQALAEGATYSASGSFTDLDSEAWTATVDYGDGSGSQSLALGADQTFALNHIFSDDGDYTVTVVVEDSAGRQGTDTVLVTVTNLAPTLTISGDSSVEENSPYLLSLSASDVGADTVVSWNIDWGDGQTYEVSGHPPNVSHIYKTPGNYTILATATDEDDTYAADSLSVLVTGNDNPDVDAGDDATLSEGGTYTASGSFTDINSETWSATVDYGDGTGPQVLALNPDKTFNLSHAYSDDGTYTVTVTVHDSTGGHGTDSLIVTVSNVPPALTIGGDPSVVEDTLYSLSMSSTDPGLDTIAAWQINWGDGHIQTLTGNPTSATHTYARVGSYTILATAADEDGTHNAAPSTITVIGNTDPLVHAGTDAVIDEGGTLVTSGVFVDPDPNTWTATVDYGDGSGPQTLTLNSDKTFSLSHTYTDNGNYTISVTVTDSAGDSDVDTALIAVANVAPSLTIVGDSAVEIDAAYSLALSSSDPGSDTIISWQVNWGDGQTCTVPGNPANASHVYTVIGVYTITATATDEDGTFAANGVSVTAGDVNDPPVADAGGPYTVSQGNTVVLDASASSDPEESDLLYTWDLDRDGIFGESGDQALRGDELGVAPSYSALGVGGPSTRTVKLRVTDAGGITRETTASIEIVNVAPLADAGGPYTMAVGSQWKLNAGGSSDPGNDSLTYNWDFDGDALFGEPASSSLHGREYGVAPTFIAGDAEQTVTVSLTVRDNGGLYATTTTEVHIVDVGLTVDPGGPYSADEGGSVQLSATATSDPDHTTLPLEVRWDLDGDMVYGETGQSAARGDETGLNPVFSTAGIPGGCSVVVFLEVCHELGAVVTEAVTIELGNTAPMAVAGGPYAADEDGSVQLSADGSTDPGDASLTYLWDLDGDGLFGETGSGATRGVEQGVSPSFVPLGLDGPTSTTVQLQVLDSVGAVGTASAVINVSNAVPRAAVGGPYAAAQGAVLNLDATASSDIPADSLSYAWDFDGDGLFDDATGLTPSFDTSTIGATTVALRVTDDDGQSADATTEVTVCAAGASDVAIDGFAARVPTEADEGRDWRIRYSVANSAASAFAVQIYASSDGKTLDSLLMTHQVTGAEDLAVGADKELVITPDFTAPAGDYQLIAVVDSAGQLLEPNEVNNVQVFEGGVFDMPDGSVCVYGTQAGDSITLSGTNAAISINGTSWGSCSSTSVISIFGQSGGDSIVNNSTAGNATNVYGGAGNDYLTGGYGVDTLFGGPGDDTVTGQSASDTVDLGPGQTPSADPDWPRIIDNGDPGYREWGEWQTISGGGYGPTQRVYVNDPEDAESREAKVTWTFEGLEPGYYWIGCSGLSGGARAFHDGNAPCGPARTEEVLGVNPYRPEWASDLPYYIGSGSFTAELSVNLSDDSLLIADAVMIQPAVETVDLAATAFAIEDGQFRVDYTVKGRGCPFSIVIGWADEALLEDELKVRDLRAYDPTNTQFDFGTDVYPAFEMRVVAPELLVAGKHSVLVPPDSMGDWSLYDEESRLFVELDRAEEFGEATVFNGRRQAALRANNYHRLADAPVSVLLTSGTLLVEGSSADDWAELTETATEVTVSFGGRTSVYTDPVSQVVVRTHARNDVVHCESLTVPTDVATGLGDDIVYGGSADDRINGGFGSNVIYGGAGADWITTREFYRFTPNDSPTTQYFYGGEGDDTLLGATGWQSGGYSLAVGRDHLFGGPGDDYLVGAGGLLGGEGNDVLIGGGLLSGDAGNDDLSAGATYSVLLGGDDNDTFDVKEYSSWEYGQVQSYAGTFVKGGDGDDRLAWPNKFFLVLSEDYVRVPPCFADGTLADIDELDCTWGLSYAPHVPYLERLARLRNIEANGPEEDVSDDLIVDMALPERSIVSESDGETDVGRKSARHYAHFNGPLIASTVISFTLSGTAEYGSDYVLDFQPADATVSVDATSGTGTLLLPVGTESFSYSCVPLDDTEVELDEFISVAFQAPSGERLFVQYRSTVNSRFELFDNDGFSIITSSNSNEAVLDETPITASNPPIRVGVHERDVALTTVPGTSPFSPVYVGTERGYPVIIAEMIYADGSYYSNRATLHLAGLPSVEGNGVGDWNGNNWVVRYVFKLDASSLPTGRYDYSINAHGSTSDRTYMGAMDIVNFTDNRESRNPFGRGWSVPGLDQLILSPTSEQNSRTFRYIYGLSKDASWYCASTATPYITWNSGLSLDEAYDGDTGHLVSADPSSMTLVRGTGETARFDDSAASLAVAAVIDDDDVIADSSFSVSQESDSTFWNAISGVGHGGDHHMATKTAASASWTFDALDSRRLYQLFATWVSAKDSGGICYSTDNIVDIWDLGSKFAEFTVTGATRVAAPDESNPNTIRVDQRLSPGSVEYDGVLWRDLGFYYLEDGNSITVTLTGSGNGYITADAVMLVDDWEFDAPDGSTCELEYDGTIGAFVLTDKYGTEEIFNPDGTIHVRRDRYGNETLFEYEPDTANGGDATRIRRITEQGGLVTEYRYDDTGRLHEVEYGRLVDDEVVGQVTTYEWDDDLLTVTSADPDTDVLANDGLATEDAAPIVWQYEYAPFGQIERITDPAGNVTEIEYEYYRFEKATLPGKPGEDPPTFSLTPAVTQFPSFNTVPAGSDLAKAWAENTEVRYTDPLGHVWIYKTDCHGLITSLTNPEADDPASENAQYLGKEWKWERDEETGRLEKYIEPAGGGGYDGHLGELETKYLEYDDKGNCTKIQHPDGTYEQWTYDPKYSIVTWHKDRAGRETFYNLNGGVDVDTMTEIDPGGTSRVTKYVYTATPTAIDGLPGGLVTDIYQAFGSADEVRTHMTYYTSGTSIGLLHTITSAYETAVAVTTEYGYDARRNPVYVEDALGRRTETTYDALGRLVVLKEAAGTSDESLTKYYYDEAGNLAYEIGSRSYEPDHIFTDDFFTYYEYDERNRLRFVKPPIAGGSTESSQTRAVTEYVYDANGNLDKEILHLDGNFLDGGTSADRITNYEYDERNLLMQVTYGMPKPDGTYTSPFENLTAPNAPDGALAVPTVKYSYDTLGNLRSETDPRNGAIKTRYVYDKMGRVTTIIQPDPGTGAPVTTYQYYPDGQLSSVSTPGPNGPVTTDYSYDAFGRLLRVVQPSDGVNTERLATKYVYDLRDNVTHVYEGGVATALDDPTTRHTVNRYDDLDRLIAVDYQNPVPSGDGLVTLYAYNAVGELLRELHYPGQFDSSYVSTDGSSYYTTATNLENAATALWGLGKNAAITHYSYDNQGRLKHFVAPDPDGSGPQVPLHTEYAYDAAGNTTDVVLRDAPGGTELSRTKVAYDNLNRAWKTYTVASGVAPDDRPESQTLFNVDGTVKAQRTKTTSEDGNTVTNETTFEYDRLCRLWKTTAADPIEGNPGNTRTTETYYDAAGNLVRNVDVLAIGNNITDLTYDNLNRQKTVKTPLYGVADGSGATHITTTYTYKQDGSIEKVQNTATGEGGATEYSYDNLGRVKADTAHRGTETSITSFGYDVYGNRTSVKDPNDNVTTYGYDSVDQLFKEEITGDVDNDGTNETLQRWYRYDGLGNLIYTIDRNGRLSAYEHDNLGRKTAETWYDTSDAVVDGTTVDSWIASQLACTPPSYSASFTYTILGQLETAEDTYDQGITDHSSYDYTYDSLGRVDDITIGYGVIAGELFELDYAYQPFGALQSLKVSMGTVTAIANDEAEEHTNAYKFDRSGRMVEVAQTGPANVQAKTVKVDYDYDTASHTAVRTTSRYEPCTSGADHVVVGDAETYANGQHKGDAYILYPEGTGESGTMISTYGTAYTGEGLLYLRMSNWTTSQTLTNPTYDSEWKHYDYDQHGQLTKVADDDDFTENVQLYSYDAAGNRNAGTVVAEYNRLLTDADHVYEYDAEGNLTEKWTFESFVTSTSASGFHMTSGPADWKAGTRYRITFEDLVMRCYSNQSAVLLPEVLDGGLSIWVEIGGYNKEFWPLTARMVSGGSGYTLESGKFLEFDMPYNLTDTPIVVSVCPFDTDVYDDLDQVNPIQVSGTFTVSSPSDCERYSYDHHNRLTHYDKFVDTEGGTHVIEYTCDPDLSIWVDEDLNGQPIPGTDVTYLYDVYGQLIGREASFSTGSDNNEYYVNERSQRVLTFESFDDEGETEYRVTDRRLWADQVDQLLAVEHFDNDSGSAEVYWPLTDHQGTVRDIYHHNQWDTTTPDRIEHVQYDPFGNPDTETWESAGSVAWYIDSYHAGREYDEYTGLYYNRARWYDSEVGRFISEDPLGFAAGDPNRYRYAANSPTNATDPTGLWLESAIDITSLVIGIGSLQNDIQQGEVGWAIADCVGIVADVVGLALPVIPGAAGIALKAYRAGDITADAVRAARGGQAALGLYHASHVVGVLDTGANFYQTIGAYDRGDVLGTALGGVHVGVRGLQLHNNFQIRFDSATHSMSGFGGVRITRRVGGSIGSELFPNSIQVKYGEGLSALAQSRRLKGGAKAGINLSVIEYMDDGVRRHKLFKSVPDLMHSEEIAYTWLTKRGLDPESVTRLYSEFHPCSDRCDDLVRQVFPKAQIEYTWPYKSQSRKDFISNIGRRLKRETLGG